MHTYKYEEEKHNMNKKGNQRRKKSTMRKKTRSSCKCKEELEINEKAGTVNRIR
jgi:hypothetical protein